MDGAQVTLSTPKLLELKGGKKGVRVREILGARWVGGIHPAPDSICWQAQSSPWGSPQGPLQSQHPASGPNREQGFEAQPGLPMALLTSHPEGEDVAGSLTFPPSSQNLCSVVSCGCCFLPWGR